MTARKAELHVVDDYDHEDDDFLAYWRTRRPPEVKRILGVEVAVPHDLPLNFGARYELVKDSTDPEDMKALVGVVFGQGVLDQWIARGAGIEQVKVILTWGMLNGSGIPATFEEAAEKVAEVEAEQAGKALPNRADRRRSASSQTRASGGTGASSKRTSNGSTATTKRRSPS